MILINKLKLSVCGVILFIVVSWELYDTTSYYIYLGNCALVLRIQDHYVGLCLGSLMCLP